MSLIKANAVQVGQSPTATQNFTLAVPSSPDGTIKLARGNAGATTQDVMSVDASGNINGLVKSTGSSTSRSLANRFTDVVNVLDFGADPTGVVDSTPAFTSSGSISSNVEVKISKGTYLLNSNPSPTGNVTWVVENGVSFTGNGKIPYISNKIVSRGNYRSIESDPSFYNGIFGYLEQNAAQKHYGTIGCHGSARTFGGNGGASEADIGISGFAVNDLVGGGGGAWALYGTAIRQPGVTGSTHGLELDIANMGNTVPLFPAQMFLGGQTHALWLGSGGEVSNISNAGTASVAIGIIRNDSNPSPSASFDKGIIFHNKSISGCDGNTGNGIAIAMAKGHQIVWYNNSNQAVAEIVANNGSVNNQQRIDFNEFGILFQDRTNGRINFQVNNDINGVNFFAVSNGVSTYGPQLQAKGSDANIDVWLKPKGTGVLGVTYGTTVATTPSNFSASRRLAIKDGSGNIFYIPVTTTAW